MEMNRGYQDITFEKRSDDAENQEDCENPYALSLSLKNLLFIKGLQSVSPSR
jgi:hypothetical protein